jgi:hypothetical protein
MNAAQVRCEGCNRKFTPSGLSQHVAKTQNPYCRSVYSTSQAHLRYNSIDHAAPSTVPVPSPTLWTSTSRHNQQIEDEFNDGVDQADPMDTGTLETPLPTTSEDSSQPIQIETQESTRTTLNPVVERFPIGCAGAPIVGPHDNSGLVAPGDSESIWAPFQSQCDWQVAHWAKMRGPTSSAFTDLLAIPEVSLAFAYHYDCGANILQ